MFYIIKPLIDLLSVNQLDRIKWLVVFLEHHKLFVCKFVSRLVISLKIYLSFRFSSICSPRHETSLPSIITDICGLLQRSLAGPTSPEIRAFSRLRSYTCVY